MVLVDTGPLVALCDARDARHRLAVTHAGRLVTVGFRLCDAILAEACFHLPYRSQRERLRALLHELRIESLPTHSEDFRSDVFGWLVKYADQEPDWADGCLAVLSSRNSHARVWTYDREFRTTWRKLDGRTIPLAVRG